LRILPGSDGSWRSLIDRRCHFGDYVHNYRQFLVVCKRQGRRRRDVAWSGMQLARYAPLDALRVAALAGYVGRDAEAVSDDDWVAPLEDYLRGLATVCGYQSGDVLDRAVDMCQAVR
jgi:hypothetical protein